MALHINKFYEKVAMFYDDATGEAGFAVLETAGEEIAKGSVLVYLIGGTSGKVTKAPISGESKSMPHGVALTSASVDGQTLWVAKAGLVKVLPDTGINAAFGNILVTSTTTAGMVKQYSTVPAADHWDEVGLWAANGTGNGALTLASIHFN